ncbi:hypothetical protein [Gallaecimonas pentaromativorans]|uniref:hypothetical protein n=1 Tax=Gallaecimonas pentaromativorans TaxID=584787 RepID=UPI00067F258D|nr:hypothetical protein [Gallaecimonas pentaromativorans]
MRILSLVLALLVSQAVAGPGSKPVKVGPVSLQVPVEWQRHGLHFVDAKGHAVARIGLRYPKGELNGPSFVSTYQNGLYGEPPANHFIKSGELSRAGQPLYWVCREVVDPASGGLRFERTFQVPQGASVQELSFYSPHSCDDNFPAISAVALSAAPAS